jgi:hypothetical protein
MPSPKRKVKPRPADLPFDQFLELLIGPSSKRSTFDSDRARYATWLAHRDRLLARTDRRLPWAYWEYEGPPECRRPANWDGANWHQLGAARAAHEERIGRIR